MIQMTVFVCVVESVATLKITFLFLTRRLVHLHSKIFCFSIDLSLAPSLVKSRNIGVICNCLHLPLRERGMRERESERGREMQGCRKGWKGAVAYYDLKCMSVCETQTALRVSLSLSQPSPPHPAPPPPSYASRFTPLTVCLYSQ